MNTTTTETPSEPEQIERSLAEVLAYICLNPLVFVSEMDVHMLVVRKLMKLPQLSRLYDTKCTIGLKGGKASGKVYRTLRIHKEYGVRGIRSARIDLVIMDEDSVKSIDDPKDLKGENGWLIPEYAFEFGTEKSAQSADRLSEHLKKDMAKLRVGQKGYLIHIHRNLCQSTGGKLKANRAKYQEYFKKEIVTALVNAPPNVTSLFLLIDIGNEGRNIYREGKVKIFRNEAFKGVNQKSIQAEIIAHLSRSQK